MTTIQSRRSALGGTFSGLVFLLLAVSFGRSTVAQTFDAPDELYFRFDEGAGSVTENIAFPGNGGPSILSTVPGWAAQGSPTGSALALDSANPQNVISTNTTFSLSGDWTIEGTVFIDPNNPLPSGSLMGDPTAGFDISLQPLGFSFQSDVVLTLALPGGGTIAAAAVFFNLGWSHFAFTYEDALQTISIYVQGQFFTNFTTGGVSLAFFGTRPEGFTIGGDGVTPPAPVLLDEVRLWRRARTLTEIAVNFSFPIEVPRVRRINFGSPGFTTIFDRSAGTFSATGTVTDVVLVGGTQVGSSLTDPLVGATISLSGSFSGSDFRSFSDLLLTASNFSFFAGSTPTQNTLALQAVFTGTIGPPPFFELGGSLGAFPLASRAMGVPFGVVATRTGQGSILLDVLSAELQSGKRPSLIVRDSGNGPEIRGFAVEFSPQSVAPAVVAATDGQGAFVVGAIALPSGSVLLNLFDVAPTIAPGTGALFGLDFGAEQFAQLTLPVGVAPFKVVGDADGNYFFGVPPGQILPGLVVDHVGLILTPGGILSPTGAIRLVF